ncbi:MAG: hypothetical protein Ct9H300mP17_13450 [Candidatus Nitrosopelagicus sp.]|nr:MAG: hypothetical protein Ct9H300mP17_13450 [Candidatus Nitrosopelagicus sp.]
MYKELHLRLIKKKMNYMDALIGDKNILKSLTEKEIKDIFVPKKTSWSITNYHKQCR